MSNASPRSEKKPVETIAASLLEVGVAWAKHGISVGRSALEASAKSLHATADVLGQIADTLEGRRASKAEGGGAVIEAEGTAVPPSGPSPTAA